MKFSGRDSLGRNPFIQEEPVPFRNQNTDMGAVLPLNHLQPVNIIPGKLAAALHPAVQTLPLHLQLSNLFVPVHDSIIFIHKASLPDAVYASGR